MTLLHMLRWLSKRECAPQNYTAMGSAAEQQPDGNIPAYHLRKQCVTDTLCHSSSVRSSCQHGFCTAALYEDVLTLP